MVVQGVVIRAETVVVLQLLLRLIQTGHFRPTNHKCCVYATNFGHKCYLALVALVFLGYNNILIGENMIKPNTLCMIRGVPSDYLGSEFNGNIVTVTGVKNPQERVHWIEPELVDRAVRRFTGCREQWLFPFQDPDALGLTNTTKELETA